MKPILNDSMIADLVAKPKYLPRNWQRRLTLRRGKNDGHMRCTLTVECNGDEFLIKGRQSMQNMLDFSVILVYIDEDDNKYHLLRCNGVHPSEHTNIWEKLQGLPNHTFSPCCHVHQATQRYQESGLTIDGFAEPTIDYSDYWSAVDHFIKRCNFIDPDPKGPETMLLFGGSE